MSAAIQYEITPIKPEAHLFGVRLTIHNPAPNGQRVWLPAWIPGSYMIRDFAKNIVAMTASNNDGAISIEKQDKQTWLLAPSPSPITIEYTVYAWDMSVRTAHLDTTHGFFNGSSVFLAVHDQEQNPVDIKINLPAGASYEDWRIATTLTRHKDTALFESGHYSAANYDELIDHPVEMGTFIEQSFDVAGISHHIVITGRHHVDMSRLCSDVKKICTTHVNMFGELPEIKRYIFLLNVVGDGYGGLEHRSSTALIANRNDLPLKSMSSPSDGYISLLGLFSHEYFHTWNIKRIKPAVFLPYNLKQETHTELLWAFEGITSYYDDLGLVRSGTITPEQYLTLLGKNITRVMRGSGRLKQSLRESSFDAWTKFYKQDENAINAIVSYYVKGSLFALALDLKIRDLTAQQHSLDDVMRRLWLDFGKPHIGVENDTIENIATALCGESLTTFFDTYLSTSTDIPLAELFHSVGVKLLQRIAKNQEDAGGTAETNATPSHQLGARIGEHKLGAKIQIIYDDGPLQNAGAAAGDVIIAIDGLHATKNNLTTLLAPYQVGDQLPVHVFRRDELMEFSITLLEQKKDTYYLQTAGETTQQSAYQSWLHIDSDVEITPLQQSG